MEHFKTGDVEEHRNAMRCFINEDENVNAVIGFLENYRDPSKMGYEYYGMFQINFN